MFASIFLALRDIKADVASHLEAAMIVSVLDLIGIKLEL
jgi:hypothetical protein